jgi:Putative peptidoglycan binding domain
MKKYLIVLFCALFGLAQIAQAANPDDVKKEKQKAQQSVHKAPQTAGKAPQHVGKAPTAFKKSSNAAVRVSSHQGNAQVKKNQATVSTHNNANVHVQKSVNRQPATVHRNTNTNLHVKKPINANNAAVAAQSAKNKQHIAQAAAQQNWQHKNKVNQNNAHIAAQRNWQNQNNGRPINGQPASTWNRTTRSNSSSLSFDEASRRWDWWRSHYGTNIVLFGRGYYYWDSGYWYPAYGYDPVYSSYEYDGPIYGYNHLPPGQVVTNVQSALQQQGYYRGDIDGSIGPLTRSALRRYQRDNGLEITAAIDEPTLASLGMV